MNCLTTEHTNTETRISTHLGWANHILTILKTFLHVKKKKNTTTAVSMCFTAMPPRSLVVTIRRTCYLNPQGTNDPEDTGSRFLQNGQIGRCRHTEDNHSLLSIICDVTNTTNCGQLGVYIAI
jgi:hypothetical protein